MFFRVIKGIADLSFVSRTGNNEESRTEGDRETLEDVRSTVPVHRSLDSSFYWVTDSSLFGNEDNSEFVDNSEPFSGWIHPIDEDDIHMDGERASVRLRRRAQNQNENADISGRPTSSRSMAQQLPSLNRSFPCVLDGSQFTALHSTGSYVEALPEPVPASVPRRSTAVVGPHTVTDRRSRDPILGEVTYRGMTRSMHDSVNHYGSAVLRNASPVSRRASNDVLPTYTNMRRNTQPNEGVGLYQLSRGSRSPSRSGYSELPQVEAVQSSSTGLDMFSSPNQSRPSRPRDIRVMSASPIQKTPEKHGSMGHSTRRTLNSGVNAQLSTMPVEDGPQITSTPNSRKMMVAPQPHYRSHHRERNDDSCRINSDHSVVQRRLSTGAVVPSFSTSPHTDNRRSYSRENPLMVGASGDQVYYVDDRCHRTKSHGDEMRVAVLEQRVRELESAIGGAGAQSPSTSAASASFVFPVYGAKGGRMVTSPAGQLVVTSPSSTSTQQLMAKDIVDKEVEIERLQSQLRKCYSRMEFRQVQYDEEVNAFRRESEEAKSQLSRVKSRLSELESECGMYREKANAVENANHNAVASSVEKLKTQEKELSTLRGEAQRAAQLEKELKQAKEELDFLELQNDALNTAIDVKDSNIRQLEDNIYTLKTESTSKINSGSTTPCGDAVSLFATATSDYKSQDWTDLKAIQGTSGMGVSLSDLPMGVPRSRSTNHVSANNAGLTAQERLSSATSQLIRKQIAATLECRLLAKCLKDIAAKAISGDAPSVNRLLGCRSDSMSESEPEPMLFDPNPMSVGAAERYLKKGAEDLQRLEKDLNALREKFVEYYQLRAAQELVEDDACKIQ